MAGGATAAAQGLTQAPAVALSDVSIAFRLAGGGTYTAVADASLHVADGEFVSIVGPTGCGKSTLLNVAAGLLAPASGHVDIYGAPLAALNRQAGYLFQADALFPWARNSDRRGAARDRRTKQGIRDGRTMTMSS